MADDLDENYFIEKEFEQKPASIPYVEDEDEDEEITETKPSLKRKSDSSPKVAEENKKKKKKLNITEILKLKSAEINKPNYAIDEFKTCLMKYITENLSSVEKNEYNLSKNVDKRLGKMLLKRKKTHNLPVEVQFKKKFNKKLSQLLEEKCSAKQKPFMIVLCSSAVRCIELQKLIDKKCDLTRSGKLRWIYAFAKHKKLNEQVELIKKLKHDLNLVYATPQRLAQLMQADAIKLEGLKYVMIDYMHRDVKQKRFLDTPEIKMDFLKLFFDWFIKLNKNEINVQFYLA